MVQVAANRVDVDEFNRWAAPLNDSIARAVAGDLAAQLGTPDVATAPMANFAPDYAVTIDVQRFESYRGQAAEIDADGCAARRGLGTRGKAQVFDGFAGFGKVCFQLRETASANTRSRSPRFAIPSAVWTASCSSGITVIFSFA